jgi:hypothetical protein
MKKNNLKLHFICFSILILYIISCTKKTTIVTQSKSESLQKAISEEPQILFLHLKITQNEKDAAITASVFDKKMVNGILDKPLQGIQLMEGRWLISLLDAEKKMITQEVIQDPINQHFEYLNDKGKLDNVTVVKKETDCFVRVQFDPKILYVKCEFIEPQKQLKFLFRIKL